MEFCFVGIGGPLDNMLTEFKYLYYNGKRFGRVR